MSNETNNAPRCGALLNDGRHVCRFVAGHAGQCHPHINAALAPSPAGAAPLRIDDTPYLAKLAGDVFRVARCHGFTGSISEMSRWLDDRLNEQYAASEDEGADSVGPHIDCATSGHLYEWTANGYRCTVCPHTSLHADHSAGIVSSDVSDRASLARTSVDRLSQAQFDALRVAGAAGEDVDSGRVVLNVCDTCDVHYHAVAPYYAHACKRVACGTDCPHPEMCEAAGSCPPSLIRGAERTLRGTGNPVACGCLARWGVVKGGADG